MENTHLRAAQAILKYVQANPGRYSWYSVVRHIDRLGVLTTTLPYGVLKELFALSYLDAAPDQKDLNGKYNITSAGENFLAKLDAQLPVSAEPELLALTDTELAVVLAVMDEDNKPFLSESILLDLGQDELQAQLTASKTQLLERDIIFGSATTDLLGVDPGVRVALSRIVQTKVAFELMQVAHGQPPQRLQFVADERGVLAYRLSFMDEAKSGVNSFWSLSSPEAAAQWAIQRLNIPQMAKPATQKTFAIPHAVISALGSPTAMVPKDLSALLLATDMSTREATSFLAAGLSPILQGTFTRLSQTAEKIQTGAILWFFDAATGWLITNPDDRGNAIALNATAHDLETALAGMMQRQ